jgi:cobalamin biosynthesis Mg chelatase CobN
MGSWNKKPKPSVSVNYGKGGGVSVTGGGYIPDSRSGKKRTPAAGIPYLKIMVAIIILVLIGLAWIALSGNLAL